MIRVSQLIVCLLFSLVAVSQDIGQIVIGTGTFQHNTGDDIKDFANLSSFVSRELAKSGMAYAETDAPGFLLFSTITYGYEKNLDINGIPVKAAEVEFDFSIKDRRGERSFGNFDVSIPESGENPNVLIRNAIKQLRKHAGNFQSFLDQSRINILAYYQQNCDRLLSEAERNISTEAYDMAILLAGQIPSEVECYEKAGEVLLKALEAKMENNCQTMVQECLILIDRNALDAAYEKAMLIPLNSRCTDKVSEVLDAIANRACEQYILQAEAYYAKNDLDKAVECLAGLETVSRQCSNRKTALESEIKAKLDATARRQWEFSMQQYNDQQAERKARFGQEVSVQNRELTMKERQQGYSHAERMKQLDLDADIRAKELAIAPELEKYRTRRDIALANNARAVESLRIQESARIYKAMLQH